MTNSSSLLVISYHFGRLWVATAVVLILQKLITIRMCRKKGSSSSFKSFLVVTSEILFIIILCSSSVTWKDLRKREKRNEEVNELKLCWSSASLQLVFCSSSLLGVKLPRCGSWCWWTSTSYVCFWRLLGWWWQQQLLELHGQVQLLPIRHRLLPGGHWEVLKWQNCGRCPVWVPIFFTKMWSVWINTWDAFFLQTFQVTSWAFPTCHHSQVRTSTEPDCWPALTTLLRRLGFSRSRANFS